MRTTSAVLVVSAVTLLVAAPPPEAEAQELVAGIRVEAAPPTRVEQPGLPEPQWGIAGVAVRTIHALGFQEADSTIGFTYDAITTHRYKTTGFPWFDADLADLPAGAQLVGLQLDACDSNPAAHASVFLFKVAPPNVVSVVGSLTTDDAPTPGCATFGAPGNIAPGNFVNNADNKYFVRVEVSGTTNSTSFGAVRVFYRLRVSPAPGAATFGDVPVAHPFFQFVEALAASGITGGCGGGNFCPDVPVTRGQMAVFLSVALGLHFPF